MNKSERGSIVVESAIIFPIVILVILCLLTFLLYFHDSIIVSLAIDHQYANQMNPQLTDEIGDNTFLAESYYISADENDRSGNGFYQKAPMLLNALGVADKAYTEKTIPDCRIYKILFYEKVHDYIDMITLDLQALFKVESIVDMIFKSLKKN